MNNLKEKLNTLPSSSGVYLMKDKNNNVIYVGKAKNLKRRVNQYFDTREKNLKTELLVDNIFNFDYILTNSEFDALMLENNLIKKYQPHYNILLKDGKNFAYIKIDMSQKFPKLEITRKVDFKKNVKYFGPYFNGISAHSVLDIIKLAYPLRSCNLGFKKLEKRECLKYSLGECPAPCTGRISEEDYKKIIFDVINFLSGDTKKIEQVLISKMNKCAELENFESAIIYKSRLEMLKNLTNKFTTQIPKKVNIDVVGYYCLNNNVGVSIMIIQSGKMIGAENFVLINKFFDSENLTNFIVQYYQNNKLIPSEIVVGADFENENELIEFFEKTFNKKVKIEKAQKGIKKTLLNKANENAKEYLEKSLSQELLKQERTINACKNLQTKLGLFRIPIRIEGYDISNISGTNKVASMVVFENGEPKKSDYRKFKITCFEGPNDFASMENVIKRRMEEFSKSKDESFSSRPDLILIDGGKGQLSSASKILRMFNNDIELISLAKKNEEIYKENNSEPIILKKSDYSLQLLQRIRDESHRFAITFHRSLRNKSELQSKLLNIEGIGKIKAKAIFLKFKTIENIKKAGLSDLTKINGINENIAKNIIKYFEEN